jgi:hypothetical protein
VPLVPVDPRFEAEKRARVELRGRWYGVKRDLRIVMVSGHEVEAVAKERTVTAILLWPYSISARTNARSGPCATIDTFVNASGVAFSRWWISTSEIRSQPMSWTVK